MNRNSNPNRIKAKKPALVDMRDKLLINAVMSDFVNTEYVDDGVRKIVRRPEKDSPLVQRKVVDGKVIETKSMVDGKTTMRRDLLNYYRVDPRFAKMSESVLLKNLYQQFIKAKVISNKDPIMSTNTYMALWLNVPIKKGARWRR